MTETDPIEIPGEAVRVDRPRAHVARITLNRPDRRNAMNAVLRDEYIADCERALRKWNKVLEDEGVSTRLTSRAPASTATRASTPATTSTPPAS